VLLKKQLSNVAFIGNDNALFNKMLLEVQNA